MMSPTANVCCKCGEKSTLIETEQQSGKSKSQTSTSQPFQAHRLRTRKTMFCQTCKICMRMQRHRMSKTAATKKNDSSAVNSVGLEKVAKKARRSRWHNVKRQEYKKLRKMLPSLEQNEKVSKLQLIEEAIRYIEELHTALIKRFKDRGFPPMLNGLGISPHEIDGDSVRELIRKLLASANPGSLPPTRIENMRTTPSFLLKMIKNKKT